ncbi:MAG TPA: translation initiation factor IF-3, partial [Ottowia sp.]|nr:translation initiation factor IF-3 [Ottowia sp.]
VRADLADAIVVEQFPKLEGRQMIMMLAPSRKKAAAAPAKAATPASEEAATPAAG